MMKQYDSHLTIKESNNPWLIIKDLLHEDWNNDDLTKTMSETLKQLLQSIMKSNLMV
ncbi:MAG: hypothetical protein ABIK19_03580 [candidate division WOR-3 bacterium]